MKVVITGVAGFCAPHLISRLRVDRDVEIIGVDRMPSPSSHASLDGYVRCDITEAAAIAAAIREVRPDRLFHLAGISGNSTESAQVYQVNLMGTVHLLEAVRRYAPDCNVLLVGSFAEYGPVEEGELPVTEDTPCRPVGPYGISKHAATLVGLDYFRRFRTKVTVARPSNVVGPGVPASLVVGAMLARARQALPSNHPIVKVGDFESERDFIAVADLADAYVRLLQSDAFGEIFNICSGRLYSIRQVAEILLGFSLRPISIDFDPNLVPPSPIRRLNGSYKKAEQTIGFRPTTLLEDALRASWKAEMGAVCA